MDDGHEPQRDSSPDPNSIHRTSRSWRWLWLLVPIVLAVVLVLWVYL